MFEGDKIFLPESSSLLCTKLHSGINSFKHCRTYKAAFLNLSTPDTKRGSINKYCIIHDVTTLSFKLISPIESNVYLKLSTHLSTSAFGIDTSSAILIYPRPFAEIKIIGKSMIGTF